VVLESAYCALSSVPAVHVRRDQLVGCLPCLGDGAFVLCAGFVVQELEVDGVSFIVQSGHDGIVGGEAMAVVFGLEWGCKDGVAVSMVGNHDVLVTTGGAEWESTGVVGEKATKWLHHDVEFA
jgi:hypothetical protein